MSQQLIDAIQRGIWAALADVHTVTVARVTGVNATTINCQPVIARVVDGEAIRLPEFVEVPPIFLQGGGNYLAQPVAAGDYLLLIVCERSFDRWYYGRDGAPPAQVRMHDYSDGFALVGVNPATAAIEIPDAWTMTGTVRMGVRNPTDNMALAGLVLSELEKIKEQLDEMVAAYNGHTHGSTPGPSAPMPPPPVPEPVASQFVEAD
ncbi:MAG TPA: Gp138 family membrane-puncturing spike protein [Devosia sp.]|nr:Gp138 family membrane-puncturing spike protein [Devosia sp.]